MPGTGSDLPDPGPDGPPLPRPTGRWRRILLVGFMGSGKSTVGRLLARELGWSFRDLDREVEFRVGRTIPEIFREQGEEAFRELEHREATRLLDQDRVVLAPGGGWAARPGRLESLGPDTLTIWLRVSPEEVLARTGSEGDARPLLAVSDRDGRVRELLAAREPFYRQAAWWVETGSRGPRDVVRSIVNHLGTDPERPLRD